MTARSIRVRGVVQGVGFRPFVFRLARANALAGWVLNEPGGVDIHLEGADAALTSFLRELELQAPPAAQIASVEVRPAAHAGVSDFSIRESTRSGSLSARISPDLPVCEECLSELFNPDDRRYRYPYINCTNCGPRYSIVERLPYDRPHTTMKAWPLDAFCAAQYGDPADRRFHAQPVACPACGPRYTLAGPVPPVVLPPAPGNAGFSLQADPASAGRPSDSAAPVPPAVLPPVSLPAPRNPGDTIAGATSLPPAPGNAGFSLPADPASAGRPIESAARLLAAGRIVAIKGIGGYHLACDARNAGAVSALRARKFRKEKPFAVMVRNFDAARAIAKLSRDAVRLLTSKACPIVLAPAAAELPGVAPGNSEIGLMLPYAPVHYLLFEAGAPDVLVMTSANRSSEPIAYEDADALDRLAGLADAFLIGERPIARRVDDSVARAGAFGPVILRRSRGYAPGAVAHLPVAFPILAVGADLKNSITLVVEGQAFVSQHIGDLDHYAALQSFDQTVADLTSMYGVDPSGLLVAHDLHPQYASTGRALQFPAARTVAIQHHRAHVASVLAEREMWDQRVIGVSFDGTGYGDDGAIWGGEFFAGSIRQGFRRVMHLREAILPGGDAAARHPVQCAAGFLSQIDGLPDLGLQARYGQALQLIAHGVRTFPTTSVGRLFDTCAALLGFTREISFEGQAAIWLEQLARAGEAPAAYPFPVDGDTLDFRPLLAAVVRDRRHGREPSAIARAFHKGVAQGICEAVARLCPEHGAETVVLSGGVFQNDLLLTEVQALLAPRPFRILTNSAVPPNDGGISFGQAALAAFSEGARHA